MSFRITVVVVWLVSAFVVVIGHVLDSDSLLSYFLLVQPHPYPLRGWPLCF